MGGDIRTGGGVEVNMREPYVVDLGVPVVGDERDVGRSEERVGVKRGRNAPALSGWLLPLVDEAGLQLNVEE